MRIHIRPVNGRLARDPRTKIVMSEAGATVTQTPYWTRRIACGDVVRVEQKDKVTNDATE